MEISEFFYPSDYLGDPTHHFSRKVWFDLEPDHGNEAEPTTQALLAAEGLRGALSRSAVVRGTPQIRATMKQIFA